MKELQKIAQSAINDSPTDEVNKTISISGSPPNFIASNYYPSIIIAFKSKNATLINQLLSLLNNAIFYSSNSKLNIDYLRQLNFSISGDQANSEALKNIIKFSKQVYQFILTDTGKNYKKPLLPEEIENKINILKSSQFLNQIPSTVATSQLAVKVGGDVKTKIKNLLDQIK